DLYFRSSGQVIYSPDHFFQPVTHLDPLSDQAYQMEYDDYNLVAVSTETEFLGHQIRISGELDYRTLQPLRLTDPNGNFQEVIFDALGMVVATAIRGKNGEGDTLDNYQLPDLNAPEIIQEEALNDPHALLQSSSSFFYYNLFAYQENAKPNYALSLVREIHASEEQGTPSPTQLSFAYSDGLGQTIMQKVPAEPGLATVLVDGVIEEVNAPRRWVGNGRTIFNNKGMAIKQYEPYFSPTHEYENEPELVEYGVTPIMHYDPVGRNIRTDLPDGTFTKIEFDPWQQRTFDQNDTVKDSQWYEDRGAPEDTEPEPQLNGHDPVAAERRAAWLASAHYNSYKEEHLDSLGRVFLLVDDDGDDSEDNDLPIKVQTRFVLNLQGSQVEVWDALGRQITINHFNLLQEPLKTQSMDAGCRWIFSNMLGNPIRQWNDRGFTTRTEYDALQRNIQTWVSDNGAAEKLVFLMVYGEQVTNPFPDNLIGQIYSFYDQAGLTHTPIYDFKGNPIEQLVNVAKEYKETIDYSAAANLTSANQVTNNLVN
ncbi:MAG: toxin, partial [Bacteroidota bacterium]